MLLPPAARCTHVGVAAVGVAAADERGERRVAPFEEAEDPRGVEPEHAGEDACSPGRSVVRGWMDGWMDMRWSAGWGGGVRYGQSKTSYRTGAPGRRRWAR